MPRSARDSDEEVDARPGRKTRALIEGVSVDSPLRRSLRIKPNVKQNESSPESPLSDASNVSNTQSRGRTRRTIAMEGTAPTEKHKTVRSRMNSVSSDVSEVTELDVGTPTKKTRNSASNDVPNRTNSRRSKRYTRAGSEANSPPPAIRVTRSKRASSMEPETSTGNKLVEKHDNELTSTPIKTRRRTSILPSEATVIEETETFAKIPMVTLDRTLPNLNEDKEHGSENSITPKKNESLSVSKDKLNTSHNRTNENSTEDDDSVKEPHNSPPANVTSNNFEDVNKDASTDDKKISDNDKNVLDSSETLSIDTIKQVESSVDNESQVLSQSENQDTSKELELKLEDSNDLKEKREDHSDKENLTTNVNDSENTDNPTSNTLLQTPKPLSVNSTNTNKLIEEKCKSPCIETNVTPKRRHSKQLSEMSNDNVPMKEDTSTADAVSNLSVKNTDTSMQEEENSDNMPKLVVSTETESISDSQSSENSNKNTPVIVNTNSSLDGSIELMECTEDVDMVEDSEFREMNAKLNEESEKIDNKECNEDVNMKMDDSNVKENINENEESEKDVTNENIIVSDKCAMKGESNKTNASEDMNENDETSRTKTPSSPNLNNVEQSKSTDVKLISDTQHSVIPKQENTRSQNIDETSNLPSNTSTVPESSDARTSPKDSILTNMNEDNVTNLIKSSQSSIVTETPAEIVEEAPETEEQAEKISVLEESLTLKKQRKSRSESNEKNSDSDQATSKENQENMEVDNDSDANAKNLFQNILAGELKGKSGDIDKTSVHSVSTERLENESEGECDLVLVDKEAWLAAENLKTEKEKESFDYDSDDTVLLKAQKDSVKAQNDKEVSMDISEDECKLNVSKNKSSNKSKRKSTEKETKDKEEVTNDMEDKAQNVEDVAQDMEDATQDLEESTNKHSTSKCNVSLQKSLKDQSLSESYKTIEMEENVPLNKSKLSEDIPKRRKSLNKSIQETDKLERSNETESVKRKKSLNKSNCEENEMSETESCYENVAVISAKKNDKNQSLNKSLNKKVKPQKLDVNFVEESDKDSKESEVRGKKGSATKKKLSKNYLTVTNVESDSDETKNISDSDDSQYKSVKLPKFLFGGASDSDSDDDNESNKSMDSDIQKEYNLHGKDIAKFSDDDVPGDECRASETESSDPDDNGSDLADFVVDDDEVEEDDEDESEEEEKEVIENEELDNGEEMQEQDVEMEVEEEIELETIKKEDSEDDKENTDEKVTDRSMNSSNKEKNKSRKSGDLSLSQIVGSDKKKKKLKSDISRTKKDLKENSLADTSLSNSFERKKSKQKRASGEFIVEDVEESLNETQLIFNKKVQKLRNSIECSTPKSSSSEREKFINSCDAKEQESSDEKGNKNTTLKEGNNSKKLNKVKGNETLQNRSLPSKFMELVTKTNLSRPMSSKISQLNKTTLTPASETPTTKYLKKEKLNESAPVLKLDTKFKKLINTSNNEERNDQVEEDENINEPNVEATQEVNDSLKRKLLKVADNILENDRQKKRKKRKQPAVVETTNSVLVEYNFEENEDSEIAENNNIVPITDTDNNNETEKVDKKKRKKKKKSNDVNVRKEQICEEFTKTKSESDDKKTRDVIKKKKKKEKTVENVLGIANTNEEVEVIKKKKKVSNALSSENVSVEQLPKKKQKKQKLLLTDVSQDKEASLEKFATKKKKLLSKDVSQDQESSLEKVSKKKKKLLSKDVSQDREASLEKVSKKKKKLVSEDDVLQDEEASVKKALKKKQKLSKNNSDKDEDTSVEKPLKKKQKLLSENTNKGNVKRTTIFNKPQPFSDAVLDSDEGPETVTFSKARDEALEVLKRTADSIKINKEMKKKKQREHMERMQKEKEIKIMKLESNNQAIKSNKMETRGKSVKRLPEDVLENLSEFSLKATKKRKLAETEASFSMPNSKAKRMKNIYVQDDFTPPSSIGSTTEFSVVNLEKIKKKKKVSELTSFRQKMLARNSRQPTSAYLMYLEKQKASGKNKFYNKPY